MNKKLVGRVIKLFIAKQGVEKKEQRHKITVDLDGVRDDKFHGKDIQRSVLIVSLESYDKAKQNCIDISYSELGENILVDFNPYSLQASSRLQIGSAILEISQKAPLCQGLSKINNKLPKLLKEDRGIFAKVIQEGEISVDNPIYIE